MSEKRYLFEEIVSCEMCGDDTAHHKVLGIRLNQSQGLRPKGKEGIAISVKKCTKCDLIYPSPLPVPAHISDHYGIPPETYWNNAYFEWKPDYYANEIKQLKELMSIKPGMKALDIGAGIGKCMISLEKAGFDVYGFEPSEPFYQRALTKMHINPDKIRLGTIEEVEYEEGSFDFITFGAVVEHLYHPAFCLEKALRWLKPNGLIHIEVPYSNYLIPKLVNTYYRLIGTNYVTNLSPMHEPFHLYEFGVKSFEMLGKRIGFTIERQQHFVCDVILFPRIFHFPLSRIMEATKTGMQLTVWLKKADK